MRSYLRRNRLKILATGLAVCMLSLVLLGVFSTTAAAVEGDDKSIEELEQDKKELNDKIKAAEQNLKSISAQKSAEQNKQQQLEGEIGAVQEQIGLYMDKIDLVTNAIAQKEVEIDQKLEEIALSEEQFARRVRAMYISNTSNSTLNTILTAKSFADMLNQTEILRRVSESDQQMISDLNRQKKELMELKTGLEEEQADLSATKESFDQQNQQLSVLLAQSEAAESELLQREKQYMLNKEKYAKEIKAIEQEIERVIAANAGADAYGDGILKWPLPNNKKISSYFGYRILYGKQDFHTGIDIPASMGTSIQAADAGKVILVQKTNTGYGWYVVVDHGGGIVTLYAHASAIYVNTNQMVKKGQSLAGVGSTGNSTGNHLHFEVRVNNKQINPLNYVKQPA